MVVEAVAGVSSAVNGSTGSGGGAGGTCLKLINTPSATYSYAVEAVVLQLQAGGTGGAAGGNGAAGIIIVKEHYGS